MQAYMILETIGSYILICRGVSGRWISEFETSLVYRVSSRKARATQRSPVSENNKQTDTKSLTLGL